MTMTDRQSDDEVLREWCHQLGETLGVPNLEVDIAAILGLAGRSAHAVLRPAAPLTTFLVGYSAGLNAAEGGMGPEAAIKSATDAAVRLCHFERSID